MSHNIYRQKLINAILYFARETSHLNLTKLFKLLSFFDFEHFAETGYPAIGLRYETFEHGPVPRRLWLDLREGEAPEDIGKMVSLKENRQQYRPEWRELEIKAKAGARADMDIFSPREQRIMERLAFIYRDATATQMSEISHEDERPWRITKDKYGLYAEIDYMLARVENSNMSKDEAQLSLNEHFAITSSIDQDPNG